MDFEIDGPIRDSETIAAGSGIREVSRLQRVYGRGRWRKQKGVATLRLQSGVVRDAEVHWYEAHDIGRVETKIKHFLDDGSWHKANSIGSSSSV